MLPDAKGGKAGPYDKIAGTSGGSILAFFSRGRGVRYGKTPVAAKWVAVCFGTNNGGNDATVQFFDGDRHLGDVVFPDTGDFHVLKDVEVAKIDIPAGADLRIVAPNHPVNIDYIDLYDTDARPVLPDARPPAPPVGELRDKLFAGAYGAFDEIVFATRTHRREHWYANFGYYCYGTSYTILNRQGRLVAYNVRTKSFRTLLEDVAGAVRDPCVHYDGRQIVFSYRPGNEQRYHLFTINADGTGLKQLTFGEYDDIEPAWLPDGDIGHRLPHEAGRLRHPHALREHRARQHALAAPRRTRRLHALGVRGPPPGDVPPPLDDEPRRHAAPDPPGQHVPGRRVHRREAHSRLGGPRHDGFPRPWFV